MTPWSAQPRPASLMPAPEMKPAEKPEASTSRALKPSNTPGITRMSGALISARSAPALVKRALVMGMPFPAVSRDRETERLGDLTKGGVFAIDQGANLLRIVDDRLRADALERGHHRGRARGLVVSAVERLDDVARQVLRADQAPPQAAVQPFGAEGLQAGGLRHLRIVRIRGQEQALGGAALQMGQHGLDRAAVDVDLAAEKILRGLAGAAERHRDLLDAEMPEDALRGELHRVADAVGAVGVLVGVALERRDEF